MDSLPPSGVEAKKTTGKKDDKLKPAALELDDVLEVDNALELDDAPESEELLVPDSLPPDSETTVPDSLPPDSKTTVPAASAFLCPRCHEVHEGRELWSRAHSWLYLCPRCGFIHLDYWIGSTVRHDDFNCDAALAVKRKREEEEMEWRKKNSKQEKGETAR